MAKQQTFMDKVARAHKIAKKCPICDAPVTYLKLVTPVENGSGAFRFRTQMTRVCKCNGHEYKI